eukprot:PhF_6_TR13623/c0_g1_i1/m.21810
MVDSVFECGVFIICSCMRQVVSPVSWGMWVPLVIFCLVIQYCNNVLSLLISGYMERIQFDQVLQQQFDWKKTYKRDIYFCVICLSTCLCYVFSMLVNMWNPNARVTNF